VVTCLERGADCLYMVQLMPLHPKTPPALALFKFRLVYCFGTSLPRLSWKWPINRCGGGGAEADNVS